MVPAPGRRAGDDLAVALQSHAQASIAPYRYPRRVAFIDELPKTPTGKVQRFRLRELDRPAVEAD